MEEITQVYSVTPKKAHVRFASGEQVHMTAANTSTLKKRLRARGATQEMIDAGVEYGKALNK